MFPSWFLGHLHVPKPKHRLASDLDGSSHFCNAIWLRRRQEIILRRTGHAMPAIRCCLDYNFLSVRKKISHDADTTVSVSETLRKKYRALASIVERRGRRRCWLIDYIRNNLVWLFTKTEAHSGGNDLVTPPWQRCADHGLVRSARYRSSRREKLRTGQHSECRVGDDVLPNNNWKNSWFFISGYIRVCRCALKHNLYTGCVCL